MTLARFITSAVEPITAEWETFARDCSPVGMTLNLAQRRDHVVGMLKAIALDLHTSQTKREQTDKSHGESDADAESHTAATAHGTDRAALGYTPGQMVAEFRALRASILRLWSESEREFSRASIDEVTRFNEAIDQLLAESIRSYAEDVEREKNVFLGILGHDLRNPLGAIMMSTTLIMAQEGPSWAHTKTAGRMLRSGTRMAEIIGDVLDFTRGRLGTGIPIVRATIDLEMICRHAVDEIVAFHPTCTAHFVASGKLVGQWDQGRIGQLVSNLVANAYQHGSPSSPIEVAVRGEATQVVLTVRNQGPVIAMRDLREIFNPFRQLGPASSKVGGSIGLGLYIAQAIVTAHHGTIEVESNEGGTTFTVRLPRNFDSIA